MRDALILDNLAGKKSRRRVATYQTFFASFSPPTRSPQVLSQETSVPCLMVTSPSRAFEQIDRNGGAVVVVNIKITPFGEEYKRCCCNCSDF